MTLAEEIEQNRQEIERLEARQRELYRKSLEAPKSEKVCADWIAQDLSEEWPWPSRPDEPRMVKAISFEGGGVWRDGPKVGRLVAVRPCDKELNGKTFVGVMIGDVALSMSASFNPDTGVLNVGAVMHNPAIFVPELKRIVLGCESWWSVIETADQLVQITDADINSTWYVQAIKAMGTDGND